MFGARCSEADEFYAVHIPARLSADERASCGRRTRDCCGASSSIITMSRHGCDGDPHQPTPPRIAMARAQRDWRHLYNRDIISMPDKWEYPWYAAWDLAFHMIPLARIDPEFAKEQLILLLREWYMHPNGQIPAYEFAFERRQSARACLGVLARVQNDRQRGKRDRVFLARMFQKLLLNFTWWVNRKDPQGKHIFHGGFLGLDNIGVFDRSQPLPTGGHLEQADGTAWMAFYCGTMLAMALELASEDPAYEDMASKFFEHFVAIADAMNSLGRHRAVGRKRRLLLRPDSCRRPSDSAADAFDGRFDSAARDGSSRRRRHRAPAGLFKAHALVHGASRRSCPADFVSRRWRRPRCTQASIAGDSLAASAWSDCSHICSMRTEFLSPYGIRVVSRVLQRPSIRVQDRRHGISRRIRTG